MFFSVSTFDATASAVFNDYTAKTQLVTLNPDDLQKPFIVVIKEDTIVENLEQFGVRITSSDLQVNIATETLLVSITDNDSK